jgi:ABC-type transport system involved in Fe-S cluster assembly fused permease/ATPase subunit
VSGPRPCLAKTLLEQITFSVLPMVFDLGVAIIYFGVVFDAYYTLVISVLLN